MTGGVYSAHTEAGIYRASYRPCLVLAADSINPAKRTVCEESVAAESWHLVASHSLKPTRANRTLFRPCAAKESSPLGAATTVLAVGLVLAGNAIRWLGRR